jgi:hypothetical protein
MNQGIDVQELQRMRFENTPQYAEKIRAIAALLLFANIGYDAGGSATQFDSPSNLLWEILDFIQEHRDVSPMWAINDARNLIQEAEQMKARSSEASHGDGH